MALTLTDDQRAKLEAVSAAESGVADAELVEGRRGGSAGDGAAGGI